MRERTFLHAKGGKPLDAGIPSQKVHSTFEFLERNVFIRLFIERCPNATRVFSFEARLIFNLSHKFKID